MYVTGAHWLTVAILSLGGLLINPFTFSLVLLHQLIYKALYLITVTLPLLKRKRFDEIPIGMSVSFLIWVVLLPFVIPWDYLISRF